MAGMGYRQLMKRFLSPQRGGLQNLKRPRTPTRQRPSYRGRQRPTLGGQFRRFSQPIRSRVSSSKGSGRAGFADRFRKARGGIKNRFRAALGR